MLHEFLRIHRSELIDRCRAKVAGRRAPRATPAELEHGVPIFLDQLTGMLKPIRPGARDIAANDPGPLADTQLKHSAGRHGAELLVHDFTIDQVVHDYGDLCQAITELASEQDAPITVHEFGILNMRLDNAMAAAVTSYADGLEVAIVKGGTLATNERLGVLAHEMRNLLNTTILAMAAIKKGGVGFGGATGGALDRSLIGMGALIDRTFVEVRLESGDMPAGEVLEIAPFISQLRVAAALEASHKGCELTVEVIERGIFVVADRHILASVVSNLLQNAFKFTHPRTHVLLRAWAANDRVLIEVEDECGGLPLGSQERIFRPFEQGDADGGGLGLGLSLSRRGVEAYGGTLHVRDLPGTGCVFTIDLPKRH